MNVKEEKTESLLSKLQELYPSCVEDPEKSTFEKVVFRLNLQSKEDAEKFRKDYSTLSQTDWLYYRCNPNPQRYIFSKIWICNHARRHKQEESIRNADCKAKLSILIKKVTKNTREKDKFLKATIPLQAEIKISTFHSHHISSKKCLKLLRVDEEVRKQFFRYFSDGMSVSEAMRFHKNNLLLRGNANALVNASANPTSNQVYYLNYCWKNKLGKVS